MANPVLLLAVGVLFFLGIDKTYSGYVGWKRLKLVEETPTSDVGDVTPGSVAAVEARVKGPENSAMQSPLQQQDDTVISVWRVEEWKEKGNRKSWSTLASGVRSRHFVLEDDTGELLVKMRDDDLNYDFHELPLAAQVPVKKSTPDHVVEFVSSEPTVSRQSGSITNVVNIGDAHGDRRYYEKTVNQNDTIYVVGRTYETDDGRTVLTGPRNGDDGYLFVSDKDIQQLVGSRRERRSKMVLGVCVLVAGIVLAAVGTGTV